MSSSSLLKFITALTDLSIAAAPFLEATKGMTEQDWKELDAEYADARLKLVAAIERAEKG